MTKTKLLTLSLMAAISISAQNIIPPPPTNNFSKLEWSNSPDYNTNYIYKIWAGTNINYLTNLVGFSTTTNFNFYHTNLVLGFTNFISVTMGAPTNNSGTNIILESDYSNAIQIFKPAPPGGLRLTLNIILESSNDLKNWVNYTNLGKLEIIQKTNEFFRAKMEIVKN